MLPILLKGANSSAADWMNLEYENDPETNEGEKNAEMSKELAET